MPTSGSLLRRPFCESYPFYFKLIALFVLGRFALTQIQAAVYQRIESSFAITSLATDPFDYAQTDVRVQITQPDSSTVSLPAFFDGGVTWRVRHTPTNAGLYQVTAVTLNGQAIQVSPQPASWLVSRERIGPGYVRVDSANKNRFITSDGGRYFPVGQDLAWDVNSTASVVNLLAKLGGARENWARIWMDDWDGKNLDWPKVNGALGQLNLIVAQKWDAIVSAAEQNGVFFQMTLQYHGQYSSNVDPEWNSNPYNSANGGFLTNSTQFFTNATAKALTKRKLRYEIARWGYSPSIMAWELFNEVQFTDAAQAGQWNVIGAWHDEMAQFIRSQDVYQHLITTSSDVNQPIWNQCDYYTHHDYPADLISALRDPIGVPAGLPVKPIFGAESGSDPSFFYGLHGPIWAGLMGGQSGGAQPWYWDRIEAESGYKLMRPLRDFVLLSGIGEQNKLAKSAPHVTCSQGTGLVFSPGGSWSTAVQDTFTVGDVAPDGIGTLPSFLQGNFHRSMTPNGFTFVVDFPVAGTFSVQILTIAASGAALRITVDNTTTNLSSFAATGADVNTNYTVTVNVGAGQHTVNLWNPGQDWVNLGNITLTPYVPMLGAYQLEATNFAALWIWHRTNIYFANASAVLSGTLPLSGLQPGNYAGIWWDTFAGTALSNFNFTVSDTNPVTLTTPAVLRSVAFYAGIPPQSSIVSPQLTQTLGTNSPALTLPLVITNGGGLPVSYSLSVTGVIPISYTAANSSQPDGPVFGWKDISAVGRDWTTNFTAVTAKTAKDEGIAGPIDIGFVFPFFSGGQSPGIYTQLYVSPNGFVTFSPFAGDTSVNTPLPGATAPTNLIAFFWDDLDLNTTGHVYTDNDPFEGTFTLQFQNVRFKGTASTVTCQLILKTSGEILMQYKSMAFSNACTVGIQDAAVNQGLQVAYNQSYLQTNMCVRFTPNPWLSFSANAGLVPGASSHAEDVVLNPAGLAYGNYQATIVARTSDNQSLITLPVALDVTPIATWRQSNFGVASNTGNAADNADPDDDGLRNIFEYAFNTNPNVSNGPPVSFAIAGDHLKLTFRRAHPVPPDISYLFEVATDLTGALWLSGPSLTTESVTDNLDGTETVVVTDNLAVSQSQAHYLRIRVIRL